MSESLNLATLVRRVNELPPLPQALTEILQALRREDLSATRSIALIERNQALAARTLRLANSAFYGAPGRVASIGDAVRMLGLRTVSGVLTASVLHSSFRVPHCPGFEFDAYWRHSIGTALVARGLAGLVEMDPDEAFIAGLMHDIGQLVLAAFLPVPAARAIELARRTDVPSVDAEMTTLGIAHPQIGAMVAEQWRFPCTIARSIGCHHEPEGAPVSRRVSLSGLVHVADAIAHALDLSGSAEEAVPPICASVWQGLGLDQSQALHLFASVEVDARELGAALQGTNS
jgi:HD-like signal output (HDOD) protein